MNASAEEIVTFWLGEPAIVAADGDALMKRWFSCDRALDETMRDRFGPAMAAELRHSADYARRHRDIIARFGRFPHRNAILGRTSTDAELRYPQHGGATFGQNGHPQRLSNSSRAGDELDA